MTQSKILKKVIQKAVKNGFKHEKLWPAVVNEEDLILNQLDWVGGINELIFNHEFAKAFWGEEWIDVKRAFYANWINRYDEILSEDETKYVAEFHELAWQYHLQQMVLEKNLISYLEKFI